MKSISFQVPAVNREDEVQRIVAALRSLPGARDVTGHRRTKIFTLTWAGGLQKRDISNALSALGYTPDIL